MNNLVLQHQVAGITYPHFWNLEESQYVMPVGICQAPGARYFIYLQPPFRRAERGKREITRIFEVLTDSSSITGDT